MTDNVICDECGWDYGPDGDESEACTSFECRMGRGETPQEGDPYICDRCDTIYDDTHDCEIEYDGDGGY